jgi:hypothetical protein
MSNLFISINSSGGRREVHSRGGGCYKSGGTCGIATTRPSVIGSFLTSLTYCKSKAKLSRYRHVDAKVILELGTRWGEWSASGPGRALPPGKDPRYPFDRLSGPQSRSGQRPEEKSFVSVVDRIAVVQSVVTHYID